MDDVSGHELFGLSNVPGGVPFADVPLLQRRMATLAETFEGLCRHDVARMASAGRGNPWSFADLRLGERVLDLGASNGYDAIHCADRVGPTGLTYALHPAMTSVAMAERDTLGVDDEGIVFLCGDIESIPLSTGSIDAVISNCVINLSPDKPTVFSELHRVLVPDGRLYLSDIVVESPPSPGWTSYEHRDNAIGDPLTVHDYQQGLDRTGFKAITLSTTATLAHGARLVAVTARKPDQGN